MSKASQNTLRGWLVDPGQNKPENQDDLSWLRGGRLVDSGQNKPENQDDLSWLRGGRLVDSGQNKPENQDDLSWLRGGRLVDSGQNKPENQDDLSWLRGGRLVDSGQNKPENQDDLSWLRGGRLVDSGQNKPENQDDLSWLRGGRLVDSGQNKPENQDDLSWLRGGRLVDSGQNKPENQDDLSWLRGGRLVDSGQNKPENQDDLSWLRGGRLVDPGHETAEKGLLGKTPYKRPKMRLLVGGKPGCIANPVVESDEIKSGDPNGAYVYKFHIEANPESPITHLILYWDDETIFHLDDRNLEAYIVARWTKKVYGEEKDLTIGFLDVDKGISNIEVPQDYDTSWGLEINVITASNEWVSKVKGQVETGSRVTGGFKELC